MHMISKKDLNSSELETVTTSRSPKTVITANGEAQTNEEATVYVRELDIFLTTRLLEDTPAVLSLKKLFDENGYSYEWIKGQKPHLIKNGIRIQCNTENFVLFSERRCSDPTYLIGHSPAPTSRSFLPTCCTPLAISQSWFCNPLLSTLLKSNRMFFTAPRLPIHVRWNRWRSGYTSVTAACRSVSWQCCTFAAHEMNFDLGFSMFPWHSMAAV